MKTMITLSELKMQVMKGLATPAPIPMFTRKQFDLLARSGKAFRFNIDGSIDIIEVKTVESKIAEPSSPIAMPEITKVQEETKVVEPIVKDPVIIPKEEPVAAPVVEPPKTTDKSSGKRKMVLKPGAGAPMPERPIVDWDDIDDAGAEQGIPLNKWICLHASTAMGVVYGDGIPNKLYGSIVQTANSLYNEAMSLGNSEEAGCQILGKVYQDITSAVLSKCVGGDELCPIWAEHVAKLSLQLYGKNLLA